MIYIDKDIIDWAESGSITPYDVKSVNPASIDLKLGDTVCEPMWYWRNPVTRYLFYSLEQKGIVSDNLIDKKVKQKTGKSVYRRWSSPRYYGRKYHLYPGKFVLCHSLEYTRLGKTMSGILLLKSSTARNGLQHLFAGYGDPGFAGEWTWELTNVSPWPITLEFMKPLMQLVLFDNGTEPILDYTKTGSYVGQIGPTSSVR
jgi:dCTP deaminase